MHGTTKEIHRLVKASRLLAAGSGSEADGASASERMYRDLLARVTDRDGGPKDVVVDVIAGTSAGGINGIYLAKALAHNLPQDDLRDLWLDKGDVKKLLRGPRFIPVFMKALWLLDQLPRKAPLRGKDMSVWLYRALEAMDERGPSPAEIGTLMPEGHALRLFVTMTDFYGYDRQVVISDPKLAHDRQHRHVFEFRYGDGEDSFAGNHNLDLAFAARATSCFPGVFPPVSPPLFESYLPDAPGELDHKFFRTYELSNASVDDTYFIDGGVLDNRPFRHAIDAVRERRAEVEVDRRLLYLEPDPAEPTPPAPARSPETIPSLLGAVSGIPRREPILDELLEVARLNERVRRLRDVIEVSFDRIADKVDGIRGEALGPVVPAAATLPDWQRQLNDAARADAGTTYATYVRSKISGVVDRLASTACAVCSYPVDTNHAFLVRSVFRGWAERSSLFEHAFPPSQEQVDFLRNFDLDYGIRRLQFVLAGVNWWYGRLREPGHPARAELDAVKTRLWKAIDDLRNAMSGREFPDQLRGRISTCFPVADVMTFVRDHGIDSEAYLALRQTEFDAFRDALRVFLTNQLRSFSVALYRDLNSLTSDWNAARRRDLLMRYLGFPFWDILLYPIQSVVDAGERDAVEVIRMSPLDADLLRVAGSAPKLQGAGLGHFKAFLARRHRENDYLWGRLDAAERLIGIVLGKDDPEYTAWCGKAFRAILDEEDSALRLVQPLIANLREQADAL
jgi:patatin-related protein